MFNKKKIEYLENRCTSLERNQETMFNEISSLTCMLDKLREKFKEEQKISASYHDRLTTLERKVKE